MSSRLAVVDCDVHHGWTSRAELLPYLDEGWQEFATSGEPNVILPYVTRGRFANPTDHFRDGSYPPDGQPGTDLEFTISDHIERNDIAAAILTHGEGKWVDTNSNPYYAAAVAQAANDWMVQACLPRDERLFGSIVVSNQHPVLAAQEIRRMAVNPKMKQVLIADNGLGKPFGHPLFDPIHEAASSSGLPIAIHAPSSGGVTPAAAAQGSINYFLDFYTLIPETFMSHLTSFITHGVFERYPQLRLVFLESGATWIAPFLWRLDANYKGLRREIPWTQRLPSDYVRPHIRVSVGPLETSAYTDYWLGLLESLGGAEVLVFGSGYPQWDSVTASDVRTALPEPWLDQVLATNSREWFGLSDAAVTRT
jgi:predicted TIM-barrel fold metal-dependent hydrolase